MSTGPPTFTAYIDESGDLGFVPSSSEWFILSAVVCRTDGVAEQAIDRARAIIGAGPKVPLHFRKLAHEKRVAVVGELAVTDLVAMSVLCHKPSLSQPQSFKQNSVLYFYTARYLLERVSWYCRDNRKPTDQGLGTVNVVFSKRDSLSYHDLRGYLGRLRNMHTAIDWSVLDASRISASDHAAMKGLQIADAVASSCFKALNRDRYGYVEERYAKMLRPIFYCRDGNYEAYGLKFWPAKPTPLPTWVGA